MAPTLAASLIRCLDVHHEAQILTFDGDFNVYKWARNRKFESLDWPPAARTLMASV